MQDRDFFDHLYQMWAKTTNASDRYWDFQDLAEYVNEYTVAAVGENDERAYVGAFASEADADFITAVHGCFPDLFRRLNDALDESDRADYERDSRECLIAELSMEVAGLKTIIEELSENPPWKEAVDV